MTQDNDIPRNVTIVLVILSVIISILGSWTVMQESSRVQTSVRPGTPVQKGTVAIQIVEPSEPASVITGQVMLVVDNKGG